MQVCIAKTLLIPIYVTGIIVLRMHNIQTDRRIMHSISNITVPLALLLFSKFSFEAKDFCPLWFITRSCIFKQVSKIHIIPQTHTNCGKLDRHTDKQTQRKAIVYSVKTGGGQISNGSRCIDSTLLIKSSDKWCKQQQQQQ